MLFRSAGADGVQLATRFVTTHECDAPLAYKETYIHAKKEDIQIIKSPVGMPGRAILNDYIKNTPGNNACFYSCIAKCSVRDIPYCISKVLISAATGDIDHSLLFCGSNAYRATHIESVSEIMDEIQDAISSLL